MPRSSRASCAEYHTRSAIGWDESRRPPEMNPITYVGPAAPYLVAAVATGMLPVATGSDTIGEAVVSVWR